MTTEQHSVFQGGKMQNLPKCKITVLKRTLNQDLIDEYLSPEEEFKQCDCFYEGQEFIMESPFNPPKDFCSWAWADIRQDILALMSGANYYWVKQKGVTISGCTDWFRPVIFKIERIES